MSCVVVGAEPADRPAAPATPTVLFVTADDLGLQLGCYGDTIATTPHLDRFAEQGIRFTTSRPSSP